jgi:CheY-like chemotaxis protein
LRLLAVDDSRVAHVLFEMALPKDIEINLQQVSTGAEALAVYQTFLPDLVFLDLALPDMYGFDVLREIVAWDPGARVVVLSADVQPTTRNTVLAMGATQMLNKPASRGDIDAIIRAYL